MFVQKETICGQIQAVEKTLEKVMKDLSEALSVLNWPCQLGPRDITSLYECITHASIKTGPLIRELSMIRNQVFNGWPQK